MTELPYYPHYIGDYNKKTAHLSLAEHGAYRLLMDHYYGTKSPLPTEKDILYRICRAQNLQEKRVILAVISQFFTEKNGKFIHKKIDEILTKRLDYSKSQSANAHAKHSAKNMPARASSFSSSEDKKERKEDTPIVPKGDVFVSEVSKKPKRPAKKPVYYTIGFEDFWEAYPRKDGSKSTAFEKYQSAINEGVTHEILIHRARKYSEFCISEGTESRYIAHAATWLNQRRWEADYTQHSDDQRGLRNGHASKPKSNTDRMLDGIYRAVTENGGSERTASSQHADGGGKAVAFRRITAPAPDFDPGDQA